MKQASQSHTGPDSRQTSRRDRFKLEAPWLILGALLIATFITAYQSYRQITSRSDRRFKELAQSSQMTFVDESDRVQNLMRSVSALMVAVPDVNLDVWNKFFAARQENTNSYHGLVFLQYVPRDGNARGGASRQPRLQRTYTNSLELSQEFQLESLLEVAEAIDKSNQVQGQVVSGIIDLPGRQNYKPSLVALVAPIYAIENAPLAVKGHLVGLIRISDLVVAAAQPGQERLQLTLQDDHRVLSSTRMDHLLRLDSKWRMSLPVNVGQRPWTLRAESTPKLENELQDRTPITIALVGIIGTGLLAALVWLMSRTRQQAEALARSMTEALQNQIKFTEDLIEFNPNPIFREDSQGRLMVVNHAWERLLKYDRKDVLGKTKKDFLPLQEEQGIELLDRKLFSSPAGFETIETHLRNAEGESFFIIVSRQVLRRADGSIDGLIGTITDVTPIKNLETELAKQREQLDLVIRSSQQGIWDIELKTDGKQYFSDRFWEMLGYTAPHFPPRFDWASSIHPDDLTGFTAEMLKHFKKQTPLFDCESRLRHREAHYIWVRARAVAQHDVRGRAIRFVGSITDVSDRKQAEATLIEASTRITEAARAKGAFLATMSHEIRTPLNGVLGMAGLLAETKLNDEQRDYIRLIRASGDTLLRLIDDVLDFSKIESGRMTLEAIPVEIVTIIEDAFELVAEKAKEKKLVLLYELDDNVPYYVLGDATRLRQILLNLLSNAIKFTHSGEIKLCFSVTQQDDNRLVLRGQVSDTGIGIPAERIGHLFQPFTQVDASTTRKYGGTGLGLAIVKRLTQIMGGDISAESVEGVGTTFTFTIQTQAARGPLRPYMQRDVFEFLGTRLLLCDHHASRRQIMSSHCRRWGFETVVALPNEVSDVLRQGPRFDILLTDFVEPTPEVEQLRLALMQDDAIRLANNEPPVISILLSHISRSELSRRGWVPMLRHDMFLIRPVGQGRMMDVLMRATLRQTNRDIATRPFTPEPLYDNDYMAHIAIHQREGLLAASRVASSAEALLVTLNDRRVLHILIAEDNEINQRVIQGILNNLGHQATVVGNGRAAVDTALKERFDLILMDIQMPELDGLGAMREIRNRWPDGRPCPPIVALTAHALADDREYYLSSGMDDYLAKPIRADDLKSLLERLSLLPQDDVRESSAPAPLSQDRPSAPRSDDVTLPVFSSIESMPVLDFEQLEDLRYLPAVPGSAASAGNPIGSLLQLFQTKGRERIDGMAEKLATEDWRALAEIAHSLRGASANMGFQRVAALCKEMELRAKQLADTTGSHIRDEDTKPLPTVTELQSIYGQIQLRYHEADSALAQWLSDTSPQG